MDYLDRELQHHPVLPDDFHNSVKSLRQHFNYLQSHFNHEEIKDEARNMDAVLDTLVQSVVKFANQKQKELRKDGILKRFQSAAARAATAPEIEIESKVDLSPLHGLYFLVDSITAMVAAERGVLYLYSPKAKDLNMVIQVGGYVADSLHIPIHGGVIGHVFQSRIPVNMTGVGENDSMHDPSVDCAGLRQGSPMNGMLVFPVLQWGTRAPVTTDPPSFTETPVGVLQLFNKTGESKKFTVGDEVLVSEYICQLSYVIQVYRIQRLAELAKPQDLLRTLQKLKGHRIRGKRAAEATTLARVPSRAPAGAEDGEAGVDTAPPSLLIAKFIARIGGPVCDPVVYGENTKQYKGDKVFSYVVNLPARGLLKELHIYTNRLEACWHEERKKTEGAEAQIESLNTQVITLRRELDCVREWCAERGITPFVGVQRSGLPPELVTHSSVSTEGKAPKTPKSQGGSFGVHHYAHRILEITGDTHLSDIVDDIWPFPEIGYPESPRSQQTDFLLSPRQLSAKRYHEQRVRNRRPPQELSPVRRKFTQIISSPR